MTNLKKQAQRNRDEEIYKLIRLGTPCHPPDRTSWGGEGDTPDRAGWGSPVTEGGDGGNRRGQSVTAPGARLSQEGQ